MFENVTVTGLPPFKSISVNSSAEEAVRTAELELVPEGLPAPGEPVTIKAGEDLLLTGYVRDVNVSHDAENHALSVTVCSRTVDATECSVEHSSGEVLDKDITAIAREFDTMGIGIESDETFPVEPRHKLVPGQSLFSTLERRARGRGILIYDTPKGRLKLATKPEGKHDGALEFGDGILNASSTLTEKGRYSSVKVRGQATAGTDKPQLRGQAAAKDDGVNRHRPLIIVHEGETTLDRMEKRATWAIQRGAGKGCTASVTVSGWRDRSGKIWTRNWLVYVNDEAIGIQGWMVIKSVRLSQDGSGDGTTATLQLADPRALGGENPRGKTSKAYAAPGASQAEYADE